MRKKIVIVFILLFFIFIYSIANASVLFQQLDDSSQVNRISNSLLLDECVESNFLNKFLGDITLKGYSEGITGLEIQISITPYASSSCTDFIGIVYPSSIFEVPLIKSDLFFDYSIQNIQMTSWKSFNLRLSRSSGDSSNFRTFKNTSLTEYYYIVSERDLTIVTGDNPTIQSPLDNVITASTTVDIELIFNNELGLYNQVVYSISDKFITIQEFSTSSFNIIAEIGFASTTEILPEGTYFIEAYLFNSINNTVQYPITRHEFNVISSPYPEFIGFDPDDFSSILGLATTTCNFSNIAGCFQNALIFAFFPSPDSLERFGTLKDELATKPPFAYIGMLTDAMKNLTGSATPVFVLASEGNIETNIFAPLRTGMTWLLWFVWGFWLYNRVRKMTI